MILPNVRGRLGPADFRLVLLALGRDDDALRTDGPDRLLDDPGLLDALIAVRSLAQPSPALFAYVAVRHALAGAGIASRELADYFAALVLEFGDHGRHARVQGRDDQTYTYLVDIVGELGVADGERAFLLRAHLGNYSLWLAGLFPDRIAYQRDRAGGPDLPYYDALGRQGYDQASRHRLAGRFGLADIYRAAAARFPALRLAFNRLSDRLLFPDVFTADRVIRSLI